MVKMMSRNCQGSHLHTQRCAGALASEQPLRIVPKRTLRRRTRSLLKMILQPVWIQVRLGTSRSRTLVRLLARPLLRVRVALAHHLHLPACVCHLSPGRSVLVPLLLLRPFLFALALRHRRGRGGVHREKRGGQADWFAGVG